MIKVLENGHRLAIFPEGTFSKIAPELTEFKSGAASVIA